MTIRNRSRRDILAGAALAGAALLNSAATSATRKPRRSTVMPPRDPTPFSPPQIPPPAMTAPARIAKLDGVDMWYWDTGGPGPVVALQHAMTGSGHVWGYQQQVFREAGYRVIGCSRRGYRDTSKGDPANLGTAVEDFRMLLDYLKIDRCHVIGTAGGGLVAGGFALNYPQRTRSITISCSILTLDAPEVIDMLPNRGQSFVSTLPHEVAELSPSYRALCKEGTKLWADLVHRARAESGLPAQPYGGPTTLAEIARISVPTLLIYGGSDMGVSPPIGRLFNKTIPNSELVVFTECGHSAYWERPAMFNATVLEFMKRRAG